MCTKAMAVMLAFHGNVTPINELSLEHIRRRARRALAPICTLPSSLFFVQIAGIVFDIFVAEAAMDAVLWLAIAGDELDDCLGLGC